MQPSKSAPSPGGTNGAQKTSCQAPIEDTSVGREGQASLRRIIEAAAAENGGKLTSYTVLAQQNDPYRVDTPALPTLAQQANHFHRQVEGAVASTLEYARRAGNALLEAKAQVDHGQWKDWLAGNFEGAYRTAALYMRIASKWDDANVQRVAHLSLREADKLLAKPLVSTSWSWAEQTRALIERKRYANGRSE